MDEILVYISLVSVAVGMALVTIAAALLVVSSALEVFNKSMEGAHRRKLEIIDRAIELAKISGGTIPAEVGNLLPYKLNPTSSPVSSGEAVIEKPPMANSPSILAELVKALIPKADEKAKPEV